MIWDIKSPASGSDYAKSLEIVTLVLETTKSWANKQKKSMIFLGPITELMLQSKHYPNIWRDSQIQSDITIEICLPGTKAPEIHKLVGRLK